MTTPSHADTDTAARLDRRGVDDLGNDGASSFSFQPVSEARIGTPNFL
jgi:hypothetical protein